MSARVPPTPDEGAGIRRVVIAVPTLHRVALLPPLLAALHAQAAAVGSSAEIEVQVIVIDNDPGCSAREAVAETPATYVSEPRRGLTAVRNRAIDEAADADALVFIDDDEQPADGWLAALVDPWLDRRPAAVSGRVESTFPASGVDPWIVAGGFFQRVRFPGGAHQPVAATNNLLLDLAFVRDHGLRFDAAFGLSGGEDIDFTRRITLAGGVIESAPDALVHDPVRPERLTRQWVLRRAYRVGVSTVRTRLAITRGGGPRLLVRVRGLAAGGARTVVGGARWGLGALLRAPGHSARGARAVARGLGMAVGALGGDYSEYARR